MGDVVRAALYVRVSTEEQARHGLSLEEQRNTLTSYADEHGMKIVGLYEDAGISARKPYKKRPALMQLLEDCKQDKVDTILFIKLDRYFRNVQSYYEVQPILDKHHVTWQAILEDYETVTASGRFKVNIMLSVAQDEADRTSERIKFVFDGKRERREALGGSPPTGYKLVGKSYAIDETKEEAVRAVFDSFLKYASVNKAQDAAEEHGLIVDQQTINRMLSNEAYKGTYHGIEGMTPPYLTVKEWDTIQSKRRKCIRKQTGPSYYIFSGLVCCSECGKRFVGSSHGIYHYYKCKRHAMRKCSNPTQINQNDIESYLLATFDEEMEKRKAQAKKQKQKAKPKTDTAALNKKLARLRELYLNSLIEIDDYKKEYDAIQEKLKKAEEPQIKPLTDVSSVVSSNWKEIYYKLSDERRRAFWLSVIKEIIVFPDRHIEYKLID